MDNQNGDVKKFKVYTHIAFNVSATDTKKAIEEATDLIEEINCEYKILGAMEADECQKKTTK